MKLLSVCDIMDVYDKVQVIHKELYPSDEAISETENNEQGDESAYAEMDKAITNIYVEFIKSFAESSNIGVTVHLIFEQIARMRRMYELLEKDCEDYLTKKISCELYLQSVRKSFSEAQESFHDVIEKCDWLVNQLACQYSTELHNNGIITSVI